MNVAATNDNEYAKKELQQQHYLFLKELQNMARDLQPKFQQRLPNELLSSLASSLLDNTVFEIVKGLKEIQQMTEKNLFERRTTVTNSHKAERTKMLKSQKEAITMESQVRPHNVALLQAKFAKEKEELEKTQEEEANRIDMKIIIELDQAVSDQQVTLEKAGVPGFYVSNKPNEIRLQMYLLQFINILGSNVELNKYNVVS